MLSYILLAIEDRLKSEFDVELTGNRVVIDIRPGGKPTQVGCENFVIIHQPNISPGVNQADSGVLSLEVELAITCTQRSDGIPHSDLRRLMIPPDIGGLNLDTCVMRVLTGLGGNTFYDLMRNANQRDGMIGEFYQIPNIFTVDPEPIPVDADWFGNDPKNPLDEIPGYRRTITIRGLQWAQIQRCGGDDGWV